MIGYRAKRLPSLNARERRQLRDDANNGNKTSEKTQRSQPMKPTDEAKRLRDEINGIIADMVCDNQSSELTEEIISKVLDEALVAIAKIYIEKKLTGPFILYQEAIHKLRP